MNSRNADVTVAGEKHVWESIQYRSPAPPRRTGHILAAFEGKLFL